MDDRSSQDNTDGFLSFLKNADFFGELHVIRGAIILVAIGALLAFLQFASAILIPILLAVFLAYVLNPPVSFLAGLRIPGTSFGVPRSLAALAVVLALFALTTVFSILIADEVRDFATDLPRYENALQQNVQSVRARALELQSEFESYIQPMRRDEGVPSMDESGNGGESSFQMSTPQSGDLWGALTGWVFGSITGILGFLGQFLTCLFVLFFILIEAPTLKTKTINIMGTTLRRRRIVLEIIHNVNEDVQRYLFNRVITNIILGTIVGLIMYAYGLRYAFLIGVLAGLFNFVPYVGPIIGTIFPATIAYVQFGTASDVIWISVIYASMTGIEGNVITPIVLGRHLKLNSLAVLLACIFWGWLWGPVGLFLAVPMMAGFKAVAEHVEGLRPVGELLRG